MRICQSWYRAAFVIPELRRNPELLRSDPIDFQGERDRLIELTRFAIWCAEALQRCADAHLGDVVVDKGWKGRLRRFRQTAE